MPEDWKIYKLGDVAQLSTGFAFKSEIYENSGILKVIRGMNVTEGYLRWGTDARYWNRSTEKLEKYLVEENDIVIGMDGSKIGKNRAIVRENDVPSILAQRVARVRAKESIACQKYIWQLINHYPFENYIENVKTGTSIPHISLGQISNFEILLPPLPEQIAIASILSALDDKIELNLQQNKTLEEMAMALYKHWFVDFGPFQNGEFVESELGLIPSGWEVKKIDAFGKVVCGKTPSKTDVNNFTDVGGYPFIKIPDMHGKVFIIETTEKVSEKGSTTQLNKLLPSGCINVSCIATVGLVSINAFPSHTNQQINSIIPQKTIYKYYLYLNMTCLKDRFLNEASGGSATLNMNTSTFSGIEILKPSDKVLADFDKISFAIFSKIFENQLENQTLTTLRDTLLPKLISGEVRVKEAQQILSSVL